MARVLLASECFSFFADLAPVSVDCSGFPGVLNPNMVLVLLGRRALLSVCGADKLLRCVSSSSVASEMLLTISLIPLFIAAVTCINFSDNLIETKSEIYIDQF